MNLHLTLSGSAGLTDQLYVGLRAAVLEGRLPGGERVPSSRALAAHLGVARGTVTAAYDRLVAEEMFESHRGSGTFVTPGWPPNTSEGPHARPGVVEPTAAWRVRGGETYSDAPASASDFGAADFAVGVPDTRLFPLVTWRRLVSRVLRHGLLEVRTYDDHGPSRLEAEIARYVGLSRSVIASGPDVVTTSGAQQALDLVARVLLEPGDVVAVEDPGYAAVTRLFTTHRAVVRGVPVDEEGLVVDDLPDNTRLVYVTPSHQFPTGVVMSRARRVALLEWVIRHDAVVVEDDYDSEFRFAPRPLEPLQALDRDGRVVYVGSFSKSLLPTLRVGYAIAPASLTPALREAKRVTVWEGDLITQSALADFLGEGHHAAHVRRVMKVYRRRRDVLLQSLTALDEYLEVLPAAAGLHVCTVLRGAAAHGDAADILVATKAAERGLRVEPLSPRYTEKPLRFGLTLGYGSISESLIGPALATLGDVLSEVATSVG